jgi:hypothetical protein
MKKKKIEKTLEKSHQSIMRDIVSKTHDGRSKKRYAQREASIARCV